MRVLFFGNMCNFAYWFAKWGRQLGYDTHALIESDQNSFARDRPEWEDSEYDPDCPPDWVHFYRAGSRIERALFGRGDRQLGKVLSRFDSIHTFSHTAAIAAAAEGHSFTHHTVGSFARSAMWFRNVDLRTRLHPHRVPLVLRFRRALRQTRHVVVSTAIEHKEVLDSPFRDRLVAVPIAYDVHKADRYALHRKHCAPIRDNRIRFVLPARQHWPFKGQDTVLYALARLTSAERTRVQVELFDWGQDRERSKALVAELGLDSFVSFRPMLQKEALWQVFSCPDVIVIDQLPHLDFHGGGLGGVARDALSVGAPVITHAAPEVQTTIFRSAPPVLHTECTSEGVLAQIRNCLSMTSAQLHELGANGREWMLRESDFRAILPQYLALHGVPVRNRALGMVKV